MALQPAPNLPSKEGSHKGATLLEWTKLRNFLGNCYVIPFNSQGEPAKDENSYQNQLFQVSVCSARSREEYRTARCPLLSKSRRIVYRSFLSRRQLVTS